MKEYYYIDSSNNRMGPLPFEELVNVGLNPNTPIWYEGLTDWTTAGQVTELKYLFMQQGAPQQPYSNPAPNYNPNNNQNYNQNYNQNCNQGGYPQNQMGEKPNNWLVWSILCTVLCCLPFGIAAIVYASQVDGHWNAGRYEQAYKAAKNAKTFTLIGIISSVVIWLIYIIFWVIIGVSAASTSLYY